MAKKLKNKRINSVTLNRRQDIKNEIYSILHEEAHGWFSIIESREDSVSKRLNSIEQQAMPFSAAEEIKHEIKGLRYSIIKNTQALEGLLKFFNMSKSFLNNEEKV